MSYHINKIEKGVIGQFSKIKEEYQELEDAIQQDDKILIICELSDLVGAIDLYVNNYNLTIDDIVNFSKKTQNSFIQGIRK